MRQLKGYPLWVGHAGDLTDVRAVLDEGIEAIVEVADSEPLAALPRELIRLRFPLSDGGDNQPWLLRFAAESVATLIRQNVPTIVCCACGVSRSVCIAAAGIALAKEKDLDVILRSVAESGPSDVSPRLLSQLHSAIFP